MFLQKFICIILSNWQNIMLYMQVAEITIKKKAQFQ